MIVTINDLRELSEIILSHIESSGKIEFELTHDYYWDIDKNQLYKPEQQPAELDLGQLSFDWETVQALLGGKKEPIGWHLVPFAAILRFLGQQQSE